MFVKVLAWTFIPQFIYGTIYIDGSRSVDRINCILVFPVKRRGQSDGYSDVYFVTHGNTNYIFYRFVPSHIYVTNSPCETLNKLYWLILLRLAVKQILSSTPNQKSSHRTPEVLEKKKSSPPIKMSAVLVMSGGGKAIFFLRFFDYFCVNATHKQMERQTTIISG